MKTRKLHSVVSCDKHLRRMVKVLVQVQNQKNFSCRREYGYNTKGESSEIQTYYYGDVPVLKVVISSLHGEVYAIEEGE